MPTFTYKARNSEGKLLTGRRMSSSEDSLSEQLFKEGITPIEIIPVMEKGDIGNKIKNFLFGDKVSSEELSMFARQMHTLSKTGVPITLALKQLADHAHSEKMATVLYGIVEKLESGVDIATAMESYPNIFNSVMISMIKVGQASGRLDEAFFKLNQYFELEATALKNLSAALRYPAMVFIAVIAAVFFVTIFVIPTFSKMFADANIPLPMLTTMLISISQFFKDFWFLLCILIGVAVLAAYFYLKTPAGTLAWHRTLLNLPIMGNLLRRILLLRFSHTFSIVISSGVPLLEGITYVADSVNNAFAKQEILSMRDAIQSGKTLTQAAATVHLFTPLELQMLAVSEETGELASMFEQVAQYYRREVEFDLRRLNDIIEPMLIVVMSILIVGIAFAVYLPIWNMVKMVR